jgi:hypothetical protein
MQTLLLPLLLLLQVQQAQHQLKQHLQLTQPLLQQALLHLHLLLHLQLLLKQQTHLTLLLLLRLQRLLLN